MIQVHCFEKFVLHSHCIYILCKTHSLANARPSLLEVNFTAKAFYALLALVTNWTVLNTETEDAQRRKS